MRAEMSDVRVNTSSGHCYLEFVEKNVQTGQVGGQGTRVYLGEDVSYVETFISRWRPVRCSLPA